MVRVVRFAALVLAAGLVVCSGCSAPGAADIARPELLTADEAMSGQTEVLSEPIWGTGMVCYPDRGLFLVVVREGSDPNMITFRQGERHVTVATWDEDDGIYEGEIDEINREMRLSHCLLGQAASSESSEDHRQTFDWRLYPLDLGEGTAAFRFVEWRGATGVPAPLRPDLAEAKDIRSLARVYGEVNGKLVMASIVDTSPEPPSEKELRALWDVQVAKVRFHDATKESRKRLSPQSGSIGTPASE